MARNISNMNACILVISCPLTSITEDQIAEARSLGVKCVSLLEISFLEFKKSAFWDRVFLCQASDRERVQKHIVIAQSNFKLTVKFNCLIVVSGVGMKKLQRSLQAHFLTSGFIARVCDPNNVHSVIVKRQVSSKTNCGSYIYLTFKTTKYIIFHLHLNCTWKVDLERYLWSKTTSGHTWRVGALVTCNVLRHSIINCQSNNGVIMASKRHGY